MLVSVIVVFACQMALFMVKAVRPVPLEVLLFGGSQIFVIKRLTLSADLANLMNEREQPALCYVVCRRRLLAAK